jgi:hypothetical protein
LERRELETIKFYCKKCKKSLRMEYVITGNGDASVLTNIIIRCNTSRCTRVMTFKNYTESQLLKETDKQGRYYL